MDACYSLNIADKALEDAHLAYSTSGPWWTHLYLVSLAFIGAVHD
jgi:hypothetical protein